MACLSGLSGCLSVCFRPFIAFSQGYYNTCLQRFWFTNLQKSTYFEKAPGIHKPSSNHLLNNKDTTSIHPDIISETSFEHLLTQTQY